MQNLTEVLIDNSYLDETRINDILKIKLVDGSFLECVVIGVVWGLSGKVSKLVIKTKNELRFLIERCKDEKLRLNFN